MVTVLQVDCRIMPESWIWRDCLLPKELGGGYPHWMALFFLWCNCLVKGMVRLGKESFLPSLLSLGYRTQKGSSRVGKGPVLRFDPLTGISSSAGRENPCIYSCEHRARELVWEWGRDRDFWDSWKGTWTLDKATIGAADEVAFLSWEIHSSGLDFEASKVGASGKEPSCLCRRHKSQPTVTTGHERLPCSVPVSGIREPAILQHQLFYLKRILWVFFFFLSLIQNVSLLWLPACRLFLAGPCFLDSRAKGGQYACSKAKAIVSLIHLVLAAEHSSH